MSKQLNINQLFQKAKTQPVGVSFETTKHQFLKDLSAGGKTPPTDGKSTFFTLKNLIIMISSVCAISLAVVLFSPANKPKEKENKVLPTKVEKTLTPKKVEFLIEEKESPSTKSFEWPELTPKSIKTIQSFRPKELVKSIVINDNRKTFSPTIYDDYKYYPKLTPEEIQANHKQKRKMVKALAKFDKKSYAYIPSGSFDYKDKKVSVQAFYMQINEVTNLEYRTFLFDLLIQGKKAEFDIAKPAQENWTLLLNGDMKSMEEQYFSHEAFNDYPVVNVSREGAEMYCVWLTKAVNATMNENEKINDVRIPSRLEWYKSASYEGKKLPFPWGGPNSTNETGCYLANFNPKPTDNNMSKEVALAQDGAMFTAKTATYNPNNYGLYNMSGNVAEMVYNKDNSKEEAGTAGGSWLSSEEEIKINGPDPYDGISGGHPGIGFRVVVTYLKNQ